MRYMLLCYHEQAWDAGQTERQAAMEEAVQLTRDLDAKGQYLLASPLQPASTATSVRVRNGKAVVTDGPFAETREVLGGFYLIDVENLDEAIRIARQTPGARVGTIEVRPVMEVAGFPAVRLHN